MNNQRQVSFNSDSRGITLLSVTAHSPLKCNAPSHRIAVFIARTPPLPKTGASNGSAPIQAGGNPAARKALWRTLSSAGQEVDEIPNADVSRHLPVILMRMKSIAQKTWRRSQ